MDTLKVLGTLLSVLSLGFGLTIDWEEKTIEVRVPRNSVVTIELPCSVKSVFHNQFTEAGFEGNSIFVSVGGIPTSLGVACEREGLTRSYSFYFFPSSGGIVYLKVKDPKLESLLARTVKGEIKEGITIEEKAERLLALMVKGKIPRGYQVAEAKEVERKDGWEVKHEYYYFGNELLGIRGKVKNVSFMQKKLEDGVLFSKGTVLVWIEKRGWIMPGEEVSFAVVKLRKKLKKSEGGSFVPWR